MQLCKNKGMYGVFIQVYRLDLQLLKYQLCKYETLEISLYKRIKIYKCAGLQIFKCVGMRLCMYAGIQICQKESMKE